MRTALRQLIDRLSQGLAGDEGQGVAQLSPPHVGSPWGDRSPAVVIPATGRPACPDPKKETAAPATSLGGGPPAPEVTNPMFS